jgi:hypothetical protein
LKVRHQLKKKGVHWLTEDMIMKLLPPGDEKRMNYLCWYKGPRINSWTALIFKDPSDLHVCFYFLSGLEEFVKK